MKILVVSDVEENSIWTHWNTAGRERLAGIDLILSAGDLKSAYLEFLVTMTGVPLLYIRGNHDSFYDVKPPEGCLCIEDKIVDVEYNAAEGHVRTAGDCVRIRNRIYRRSGSDSEGVKILRIAGLGGSMRYKDSIDMYTEREMSHRIRILKRKLRQLEIRDRLTGKQTKDQLAGVQERNRLSGWAKTNPQGTGELMPSCNEDNAVTNINESSIIGTTVAGRIDILLTHAPCRGYGDMDDLPHRGFECFNDLLCELRPSYHIYGHVHPEYGKFKRIIDHPSGTSLINASGMYNIEI